MKHRTFSPIVGAALLLLLAGCTSSPPAKTSTAAGADAIQELKAAEKDARAGNEDKAIQEIEAAKKDLILEDKQHPYAQPMRSVSGQNPKAAADEDALKELQKAEGNAKKKLAGDAADEIRRAREDVEAKESARR